MCVSKCTRVLTFENVCLDQAPLTPALEVLRQLRSAQESKVTYCRSKRDLLTKNLLRLVCRTAEVRTRVEKDLL
jgi:hypothetical protein